MLPANTDYAAAREKARQAHSEALAKPLRREFKDDEHWQELARDLGERLPAWTYPPEPKTMRRWLRRLGVGQREYLEAVGLPDLQAFIDRNQNWPLRAWVGVLMEYAEERDQAKKTLTRQPE